MMNITLLAAQAALADTLAGGNPVLTPVSEEARMNLWDMAMKGGWIMLVLALLSVVCFYIFFERMAVIRKAGKDDPLFMERIRDYIRTGEIKSAINYCRITNTPSARMIEKGITRMGRPVADVQAAIENSGNIEVDIGISVHHVCNALIINLKIIFIERGFVFPPFCVSIMDGGDNSFSFPFGTGGKNMVTDSFIYIF